MVRRKTVEPEEIVSKQFSLEDIRHGVTKLNRRIEEVKQLETDKVQWDNQRSNDVEFNIRETIREVFGDKSPEFKQHQYHDIWDGPHIMGGDGNEQYYFQEGIKQSNTMLEGLIKRLHEKKEDMSYDTTARTRTAFEGFEFHERIKTAAYDLYKDAHYAEAVFSAAKALVNYVKEKSGEYELDGTGLMSKVFSKNKPALSFNLLADQTDLDEQEGLMHLFMGAALAIRNPRGHNLVDDDPQTALEHLILISHLAKRLDKAKKQ